MKTISRLQKTYDKLVERVADEVFPVFLLYRGYTRKDIERHLRHLETKSGLHNRRIVGLIDDCREAVDAVFLGLGLSVATAIPLLTVWAADMNKENILSSPYVSCQEFTEETTVGERLFVCMGASGVSSAQWIY